MLLAGSSPRRLRDACTDRINLMILPLRRLVVEIAISSVRLHSGQRQLSSEKTNITKMADIAEGIWLWLLFASQERAEFVLSKS